MYNDLPDHPTIRHMEGTGYPDGLRPEYPCCPICGKECDTVYRNRDYEIVGCGECLCSLDAWEEPECFPGKEEEE